ncbi:AEC family transporter [Aneurinibacillus thermoaerophilus]|uniref:AEC family transporter n=1 Tax=Aneurinibacillus thermoaerophilus TaxID=143495 RepID=UPI002E2175F0|nr:AEC family transporter [Aneurinibacillus thermoaerophilus]
MIFSAKYLNIERKRERKVEISAVLSSILIMAAMILIGALLANRIPFTTERRQLLIAIIINVAMPCIILNGVFQTKIDSFFLSLVLLTFLGSIIINCLGVFLGWMAAQAMRVPPDKAKEMALLSGLGNTGFIGIPLCAALFGPKGALLAAIFDAGLDFTIWTLGVIMLQREKKLNFQALKALINIPMLAIFTGMLVAFFQFTPPSGVMKLTETLASLASPLAMIYIGMLIPSMLRKKSSVTLHHISMPLVMKLCIFPVITALLLYVLSLLKEVAQIIIVQSTMPSITLASILFARYSRDEEYGAAMTVFSTLASITTIPFMTMLGFYLVLK